MLKLHESPAFHFDWNEAHDQSWMAISELTVLVRLADPAEFQMEFQMRLKWTSNETQMAYSEQPYYVT